MRHFSSASPFYKPTRVRPDAPSEVPTLIKRLRQLPAAKRNLLLCLAGGGVIVVIALLAIVFIPDTATDQSDKSSTRSHPTAISTSTSPLAGTFTVATTGIDVPVQVDIKQYGPDFTGTLTTTTCKTGSPQLVNAIVTGHLIDKTVLSLTISWPNQNISETTVYTLTAASPGIILSWRDAQGRSQFQRWTPSQPSQFNLAATAYCKR
jgi:hypothetical protein